MVRDYITDAERYILSFITGGQFHAENRQLIHDQVSPLLIKDLLETYDFEDALSLLDYVLERVDGRREKAKDRRLRYELLCYRSWLMNLKGQIQADYVPVKAIQRRTGFLEAMERIMARQQVQPNA